MEDQLFIQLFSNIDTHLGRGCFRGWTKRNSTKTLLPGLLSREMQEFLSYQPDSAGYLMETTVTTFNVENTVQDVLERIRKLWDGKKNDRICYQRVREPVGKSNPAIDRHLSAGGKLSMLMQAAPAGMPCRPRRKF